MSLHRHLLGSPTQHSVRRSSGHAALTVLVALTAGSGLAVAGGLWWSRGAAVAAVSVVAPDSISMDTVVVYGPQVFSTPNGGPQNHVERFAVTVMPGRRYTLRVDNGAPDGTGRVSGGSVVLNGWEVLSSADLNAGGTGWTRVIQPLGEDTIQVTVDGNAGATLTVSVASTTDASFLVYGMERFVRTNGTPVTETRHFTLPASAAPPYRLCVVNGNPDGTQRISSATIAVDGVEAIGQSNFSQQVGSLSQEVSLQPGVTSSTLP